MKNKFNFWVITALIFGVIAGLLIPEQVGTVSFIGTIYINMLKFLIIPIIFTSIMLSIYNTRKSKTKILGKTLFIFIAMFIATFLLTSVMVYLIDPLKSINLSSINFVKWTGEIAQLNYGDVIVRLFPNNLATLISENAIFACILFAAFFGLAASTIAKPKPVIDFFEGIKDIFNKLLGYIMYLTPFAVFALVSNTVADYGVAIVGVGAKYIGIAYLASLLTMILIMILPVWIYARISPADYIRKAYKVWIISSSTCSSAATLPHTIRACNEEFGVPEKITNLVVPLGCTIHMCGGAVSFALLALFTSSLFGLEISFGKYILMLIGAIMINMGAPGIPNGGVVLGATYLSMLNIPLSFMGIYSGMYRLLDMAYTTLNVTGDITTNVLIYESEKRKEKL